MTSSFAGAFGWGLVLWLVGYVLGIVLFAVVPPDVIGWIIMPIGTVLTLWVAYARLHFSRLSVYLAVGLIWTATAIALDYALIVKLFQPADGYYKLDVYLYYALTLAIPITVAWWKASRASGRHVSYGAPAV